MDAYHLASSVVQGLRTAFDISEVVAILVGAGLTYRHHQRLERTKTRLDVLRRLLTHRHSLVDGPVEPSEADRREFYRALNEAMILYHDEPRVTKLIMEFHELTTTQADHETATRKLTEIIMAMISSIGIKKSNISPDFIERPFVPRSGSKESGSKGFGSKESGSKGSGSRESGSQESASNASGSKEKGSQ